MTGVTFDAVGAGGFVVSSSSPLTWLHTCGAGATALFVDVTCNGVSDDIGGVTYNGIAMTKLAFIEANNNVSGGIDLWYLANPPTGSAYTVQVTPSSQTTMTGNSVSYAGSSGYQGLVTNYGGSSGSTGAFGSVSSTDPNGMCVGVACNGTVSAGAVAVSPATLRYNVQGDDQSAANNSFGADAPSTGSSVEIQFSNLNDDWWGWIGVELLSAGGGSTPITLADVAAEVDDSGGIAVSASTPVADVAGATDSFAVTVSATLTDAGAEADAVAVMTGTVMPLAAAPQLPPGISNPMFWRTVQPYPPQPQTPPFTYEAANPVLPPLIPPGFMSPMAFEAQAGPWAPQPVAPSTPITLTDAGAETDATAVSAGVSLADPGASTDSPAVSATVPLADTAAEIDAITAAATVTVADAGAETDSPAVSAAVPLPDVAGETDSISVLTGNNPALTDAAGETDSIAVSAQIAVADAGAEVDAPAVSASVLLPDAAGATDSPQISATVPVADAGAETDLTAEAATIAVADSGGSLDSVASSASVSLADAGGAPDSVQISAATILADVAGVADVVQAANTSFLFRLPDAAGATESWYVTVSGAPDVSDWTAHEEGPRWRAQPAVSRWAAKAADPRWVADAEQPRWQAQPAGPRWRVTPVNFDPVAAISPENINVNWDSSFAGTEIDPTGQTAGESALAVKFAFPVSSGNPLAPAEPVTWFTGDWMTGTNCKGYIAYVTVGPGTAGPTLTAGTVYDVWSQVLGTPDSPAKFVGQLRVY